MSRKKPKKKTVIIVGLGPAGFACAYEAIKKGYDVTVFERGNPINKRECPSIKFHTACRKCNVCDVMCGSAGAGAFSDGKMTIYVQEEDPKGHYTGGNLPYFIGYQKTKELMESIYQFDIEHGAPANMVYHPSEGFLEKFDRDLIANGLYREKVGVAHYGTSCLRELYSSYEQLLIKAGVKIVFNTQVKELIKSPTEQKIIGVVTDSDVFYTADNIVIASGRSGTDWFKRIIEKYDFPSEEAPADFGFRVEVPNYVMETVNQKTYEAKIIGYDCRMFCTNPFGFVVNEQTGNVIYANGHSDNIEHSDKTNFAVLVTTYRINQQQVRNIGAKINKAGEGQLIVQRYVDLKAGVPSSSRNIQKAAPTLKTAHPGNMRGLFPEIELQKFLRYMDSLANVIPGITGPETLCYGLEAKLCNPGIVLDSNLRIQDWNVFVIGDAGKTRGLSQSRASGRYIVDFFE